MKKILKLLTAFLVLSLVVSVMSLPVKAETDAERYATWISRTPEAMQDNAALRALEYIGYDVTWLREKGCLYDRQYIASKLVGKTNDDKEPIVNYYQIPYNAGSSCSRGYEVTEDIANESVDGLVPDIAYFQENGLVCASFISYYLFNYLPHIEDVDTSHIREYMEDLDDPDDKDADRQYYRTAKWAEALQNAAADSSSGVTMYTNEEEGWANLVPGDIVVFTQEDDITEYKHIAIYAGTKVMYDGEDSRDEYHYIIHMGSTRGPDISTAEYQALDDDPEKNGIPTEFYHLGGITAPLPEPEPELGGFIVQKESNSQYTDQFFKFNLWRVEEDESRTHIGEYSICAGDPLSFGSNKKVFEDLPVGQYVIQEDQTPVDGWTLDSAYHYITATPYDPDTYYEGYPTVTLTNTLANDGGLSIKVTKQTNTGTGADRGWTVNLYYQGVNDYEWQLIDTKTTAQDAADPSCTFLLTEEELWELTDASSNGYQVTGQFMVMEDQTPVDGWIIDDTQYIFDAKLGGSYTATFTNSACGSMTVTKVNYEGEPISGSTMLLEWSADGTTWTPVQYSAGDPVMGG